MPLKTEPRRRPPYRFCWLCGKQLYGNGAFFDERVIEEHVRVLHKACAEKHDRETGVAPPWKHDEDRINRR